MDKMEKNKKQNPLKTFLTIAISLVFAFVFMGLALRGLDFDKIGASLIKADYLWILISSVFGLLAYFFRAIRWNLLLEPLGYKISNSNSLWAISFGYLMNLTIPRSGELARSTALYRVEQVPIDQSFGTIILERVVDLVCMFLFLLLTLIFKYDAVVSFYKQSGVNINPLFWVIFLVLGILMTVLFFRYKEKMKKIALIAKVIAFIEGIFVGLSSIVKLRQKGKFIFQSIAIWICYYLAAYIVCLALPETSDFTFADGFFLVVVGTLGMMVPASGGIGAFHFALKLGVSALFLSIGKSAEEGAEVGLSYAFLSHTMQILIMLIMGGISIPMLARAKR